MESDTIEVLKKLLEENDRLKAAGVRRNDPATWRPDLTKSIDEYLEEIRKEGP